MLPLVQNTILSSKPEITLNFPVLLHNPLIRIARAYSSTKGKLKMPLFLPFIHTCTLLLRRICCSLMVLFSFHTPSSKFILLPLIHWKIDIILLQFAMIQIHRPLGSLLMFNFAVLLAYMFRILKWRHVCYYPSWPSSCVY